MREESRLALLFFLSIPALLIGSCGVRTEWDLRRTRAIVGEWSGAGVDVEVVAREMYTTDRSLALRLRSPTRLVIPPGLVLAGESDRDHLLGRARAAGVDPGMQAAVWRGEIALPEGNFCHPFPCNASMVVAADGLLGYLVISGI